MHGTEGTCLSQRLIDLLEHRLALAVVLTGVACALLLRGCVQHRRVDLSVRAAGWCVDLRHTTLLRHCRRHLGQPFGVVNQATDDAEHLDLSSRFDVLVPPGQTLHLCAEVEAPGSGIADS